MKDKKLNQVELKGRCTGCDANVTLTSKQIQEGERDGAALSNCCFMPIIVDEAKFSTKNKTRNK